MVCWNSGNGGALATSTTWLAFLHALTLIAPKLQPPAVNSTISPLSPPDVQVADAGACQLPDGQLRASGARKMRCGDSIIIFTDMEPNDLWAMANYFKGAKGLECNPSDYPIKAVFGGGGFNADMTLAMLKKYLQELRRIKVVPSNLEVFNIDEQVYAGTLLPLAVTPYDDSWGQAFGYTAADVSGSWPRQDPLNAAMNSLRSLAAVLSRCRSPIIYALRPLYELVIPWYEGIYRLENEDNQCINLAPSEAYQQQIQARGWGPGFFTAVMNAFKRSDVYSTFDPYAKIEIRYLFKEMVRQEHRTIDLARVVGVFSLYVLQAPKMHLMVHHPVLFDPLPPSPEHSRLFTMETQPAAYQRLTAIDRRNSSLSRMVLEHTRDRNKAFMKMQMLLLWKVLRRPVNERPEILREKLNAFTALARQARSLSVQEYNGDATWEQQVLAWDSRFQQVATELMPYLSNPEQRAFGAESMKRWATVAPCALSYVGLSDVLVPLLYEGADFTNTLVRMNVALSDSGVLTWTEADLFSSDSQVFITKGEVDADEATYRLGEIKSLLDDEYGLVFRVPQVQ